MDKEETKRAVTELLAVVDQTLQPMGFRRTKKKQWTRGLDGVEHVVELQSSNYGPGRFYVNLAVNFLALPRISPSDLHIMDRLCIDDTGGYEVVIDIPGFGLEANIEVLERRLAKGVATFFAPYGSADEGFAHVKVLKKWGMISRCVLEHCGRL